MHKSSSGLSICFGLYFNDIEYFETKDTGNRLLAGFIIRRSLVQPPQPIKKLSGFLVEKKQLMAVLQ